MKRLALFLFVPLLSLCGQVAPGPTFSPAITKQAFVSSNGRFQVTVENPSVITYLVATMKRLDRKGPTNLWTANFIASPWIPAEALVSDDGSFCVIPTLRSGWIILKNGREISLLDPARGTATWSASKNIIELDQLNNENIVRVWNRTLEKWSAYSVSAEKPIDVTPELIARWNEATRLRILQRFARAQAQVTQQKIGAISKRLLDLTQAAIPPPVAGDLNETHFEFLALLHRPEDRIWFERLLRSGPDSSPGSFLYFNSRSFLSRTKLIFKSRGFRGEPRDPYVYSEANPLRILADNFLILHDGKLSNNLSSSALPEKLRYLAEVSGSLKLPVPVGNQDSIIRVHLVPAHIDRRKEWLVDEITSIDARIMKGADVTDKVKFAFKTVVSGQYFLKAIWDKRRPFTDLKAAGPGDYETKWIGPFDVAPGAAVTHPLIPCDLTAPGGDAYYAADKLRHKAATADSK